MGNEVLLTLRQSRKAFIIEYCCALVFFALLVIARYKGVSLPSSAFSFISFLALTGFVAAESQRYLGDRYKLTDEKLIIIRGIVRIRKRNVYYQPLGFIPDIHVRQSGFQRLLGYGTVSITLSGEAFEIKNVNDPNSVLEMLEGLIGRNKHQVLQQQDKDQNDKD